MSRLFSFSIFRPCLSAMLLLSSICFMGYSWSDTVAATFSETPKQEDASTEAVKYYFSGMAPLLLPDSSSARQEFGEMLREAKRKGLNAISVDVWWGKVAEKSKNPADWNWQYYDDLFHLIKANNLEIIPILSTHQCGGGFDETCNIPLPSWLTRSKEKGGEGFTQDDLFFKSETNRYNTDAISPWATENPQVLAYLQAFMEAFKTHIAQADYLSQIKEIDLSLGPSGELRYPSYNFSDGWTYPGRGFFQSYSEPAIKSFRTWALNQNGPTDKSQAERIKLLNEAWGTHYVTLQQINPPLLGWEYQAQPLLSERSNRKRLVSRSESMQASHRSIKKLNPTEDGLLAQPFVDDLKLHQLYSTVYMEDFIAWYNDSLLSHSQRIIETAAKVFSDSQTQSIALGIKIPSIHWKVASSTHPHIAELTAGLMPYNNDALKPNAASYRTLFYRLKTLSDSLGTNKRKLILYLTALDQYNHKESPENSLAEDLVRKISTDFASQLPQNMWELRGENGLACDAKKTQDERWRLIQSYFGVAATKDKTVSTVQSSSLYHGFNLLRFDNTSNQYGCNPWQENKEHYWQLIQTLNASTQAQ
jgi:beta-amylase